MRRLLSAIAASVPVAVYGHETGYPHMHFFSDPDNPAGLPTLLVMIGICLVTVSGVALWHRRKSRRDNAADRQRSKD